MGDGWHSSCGLVIIVGVAGLGGASQSPSHISKMVLFTVKIGPPNWTKSRTFQLRFKLAA